MTAFICVLFDAFDNNNNLSNAIKFTDPGCGPVQE